MDEALKQMLIQTLEKLEHAIEELTKSAIVVDAKVSSIEREIIKLWSAVNKLQTQVHDLIISSAVEKEKSTQDKNRLSEFFEKGWGIAVAILLILINMVIEYLTK